MPSAWDPAVWVSTWQAMQPYLTTHDRIMYFGCGGIFLFALVITILACVVELGIPYVMSVLATLLFSPAKFLLRQFLPEEELLLFSGNKNRNHVASLSRSKGRSLCHSGDSLDPHPYIPGHRPSGSSSNNSPGSLSPGRQSWSGMAPGTPSSQLSRTYSMASPCTASSVVSSPTSSVTTPHGFCATASHLASHGVGSGHFCTPSHLSPSGNSTGCYSPTTPLAPPGMSHGCFAPPPTWLPAAPPHGGAHHGQASFGALSPSFSPTS